METQEKVGTVFMKPLVALKKICEENSINRVIVLLLPNFEKIINTKIKSKEQIPMFTQDVITIKRGNSVMKGAGVPTFGDGSLVVNDFIGADTKSVLMAWQRLSYDVKTERVGNMADYKKICYLFE